MPIADWSTINKLTISAPKSKSLLIGRQHTLKKSPINKQLTLFSQKLEWVDTFTYLGLPIDYLLNFDAAISNMHRKAAYRYRTLLTMRDCLSLYGATTMIRSMIVPYLDYGSLFVSTTSNANINKIQTLQNKIIKTALRAHRLTRTNEIHSQTGILLFKDRIIFNQLKYINRNLVSAQPIFTPLTHSSSTTRGITSNNLILNTPNITTFRKSFCYNGVKVWNGLPNDLRSPQSFFSFKKKLKARFINNYCNN